MPKSAAVLKVPKQAYPAITPESQFPAPCPHCGNNVDKFPTYWRGRRPRWVFSKPFRKAVNNYFYQRLTMFNPKLVADKPVHLTGLCAWLNIDHQTLQDYEKRDFIFRETIARARRIIQAFAHDQLYRTQGSTKGIEFDLRCNWKWRDQEGPKEEEGIEAWVDKWEREEHTRTRTIGADGRPQEIEMHAKTTKTREKRGELITNG